MPNRRDKNRHNELKGIRSPVVNLTGFDLPEAAAQPGRRPTIEEIAGVAPRVMHRVSPDARPQREARQETRPQRETRREPARVTPEPSPIVRDEPESQVRVASSAGTVGPVTANLSDFDVPEPKSGPVPTAREIAARGAPTITS